MSSYSSLQRHTMEVEDDEFIAVSEGRIRIRIGVVAYLLVLCLVIVRLAEISLFAPEYRSENTPETVTAFRADIVDRQGELLATTLKTYSLFAEPKRVWNPEETAIRLSNIRPHLDIDELQDKLSRDDLHFVWLERGLTPAEKQSVFELGLPGLKFKMESKRVYPRRELGAHFVGFTNVDLEGSGGVERALNDRLKQEGAPPVALSLDMRVQYAVTEVLDASIQHFDALSGAATVLDMKTGEIISLVSLPSFDPNVPGTITPETGYNHASMSTYDLGSVFKPLTMAMALEDGVVNHEELFQVQKPYRVLDKWIRDDHPSAVPLNIRGVLAESSNRGTAMIAQRIGKERQQYHLRKLGLMDRVPMELAESAKPQIQEFWGEMATVTVSYGHGISVTPLALAVATGAMLNDGIYVRPTVLKRSASNEELTHRVFSEKVSDDLRHMMRAVVTEGTGGKADVPGYGVMGKTGTAEKPALGGYDQKRLVTSFVAAFPHSDPRYVLTVTFDEPKGLPETYGYVTAGWNAAPTAGEIIDRIGPMLPYARDIPKAASLNVDSMAESVTP